MREVVNISMPPAMIKEIKKAVQKGEFSSTSAFFREMFKLWHAEELLFRDLQKSMADIKAGRYKEYKSIRDLM